MNNILTVTNDDLSRLSPEQAVDFFAQLLRAEATLIGLGKNLINVPSAIIVADGGIDAEVKDAQGGGQGIIKPGLTRYQIKTGIFNLSQEKYINEILFREGTKVLKPKVKTCLDQNGTFIVVLFGYDDPEKKDDQLIGKFLCRLENIDKRYKAARIEIWRQNQIISFIQPYPSLALQLNGRSKAKFDTHESWENQAQMRTPFVAGESQISIIDGIKDQLLRGDPGNHIRIRGEPGIGKTRLVLEATRSNDLAPFVIYTSADNLYNNELLTELIRDKFYAILVIDECDPDNRAYFSNRLKYQCPNIQVISIYSDWDNASEITFFDVTPLDNSSICEIIASYGILRDQAEQWSGYCSGSPRVAHVVGFNLSAHPDDILKPQSSVNVWERYVAGNRDVNSEEVRKIRVVLRYLALFKRFGYGGFLLQEADQIAQLIRNRNPEISLDHFHEIIKELRNRKILQGENTLFITPKLLHIKLWIEWWDCYGQSFDIDSLNLSPKLYDWFFEMFEYTATSQAAKYKAEEILGVNGPFQNQPELLKSEIGSRYFYHLSKAEPQAALFCLQNTLGTWSKEELMAFTDGRRNIIWALENITAWRKLFADGVHLLLALAEAENEKWSNNASGVFGGIFRISSHAKLSKTEASPAERFPVLRETLSSPSKERRLLGLKACEIALTTNLVGLVHHPSNPLEKKPDLWKPSTWGELFDSYRQVWQLVYASIDVLPTDESDIAIKILINAARSVAHYVKLNDMVLGTMDSLSQRSDRIQQLVTEVTIQFLRYSAPHSPDDVRQKWEELHKRLAGNDFHSRLVRYIRMNPIEDYVDTNGNITHKIDEIIRQLSDEAMQEKTKFLQELDWLIFTDSSKAYNFGYEIGLKDEKDFFLSKIIKCLTEGKQNINLFFPGGYLRALRERQSNEWENLLDTLMIDVRTKGIIPELSVRAGVLSDRSAQRIYQLLKENSIQPENIMILAYGQVTRQLSETIVSQIIEDLVNRKTRQSASVTLAIFTHYFLDEDIPRKLPEELTFKVITHPGLIEISDTPFHDQMAAYYWKAICHAYVSSYPENAILLVRFILDNFENNKSIIGLFNDDAQEILSLVASRYPHEMWNCVVSYITFPFDSLGYQIMEWLRGTDLWGEEKEGALAYMIPDDVWNWVEQDVEQRAWFLATSVPKILSIREGKLCWASELLIHYGDREDVRHNLKVNFSNEGWRGSNSQHLQEKIKYLLEFKEKESNNFVITWILEYIDELKKNMAQARILEERRDF